MLKSWKETRFLNLWNNLNLYYDATPLFVAKISVFHIIRRSLFSGAACAAEQIATRAQ